MYSQDSQLLGAADTHISINSFCLSNELVKFCFIPYLLKCDPQFLHYVV